MEKREEVEKKRTCSEHQRELAIMQNDLLASTGRESLWPIFPFFLFFFFPHVGIP